jgi:hypothetical protein
VLLIVEEKSPKPSGKVSGRTRGIPSDAVPPLRGSLRSSCPLLRCRESAERASVYLSGRSHPGAGEPHFKAETTRYPDSLVEPLYQDGISRLHHLSVAIGSNQAIMPSCGKEQPRSSWSLTLDSERRAGVPRRAFS